MDIDSLMALDKDQLPEAARSLAAGDIRELVELLSRTEDTIRYRAFLLLQYRSALADDMYPYWDDFRTRLTSGNSYQRSIGIMLLAENARWDAAGRAAQALDDCLALLRDDKPITIRQCVQSLGKIALAQPALWERIAAALVDLDLMAIRETMRKSVLQDILQVLLDMRPAHSAPETEQFLLDALSGGILDAKAKKQLRARL